VKDKTIKIRASTRSFMLWEVGDRSRSFIALTEQEVLRNYALYVEDLAVVVDGLKASDEREPSR